MVIDIHTVRDLRRRIEGLQERIARIRSSLEGSAIRIRDLPGGASKERDRMATDVVRLLELEDQLKARVQALLRRTAKNRKNSLLTGQDLSLNCDTRDVTRDGKPLELTFKEFELLKLLMENSERVMTRSELLNLVWGIDFEGETRTLDMHVRTLRQKLGDDADNPRYIRTVRGVGYRFNCG